MKSFSSFNHGLLKRCALALVVLFSVASSASAVGVDSASIYMTLGKKEQEARRYPQAWKYFEQAAKKDPTNADAHMGIAEVCRKMNKGSVVIKSLEEVVKLRPNDNKALLELVTMQFNYGQWEKTITLGNKLHDRSPNEKGLAYMVGKAYYSQQDYAQAIPILKEAGKEDPKNAEVQYLIGRMMVQMSNYKAAVPYYAHTLSLDSTTETNRFYEYALVLAMAGQHEQSVTVFESTLGKGFKARDDFYMNYAYTLADAKQTGKALSVFEKLLVRRPNDIALLEGMADVCYHSGRYKEALGYWDNVLRLKKDDARTIYHIGLAYIKLGKDTDGKALCDRAIQMEPALGVLRHEKSMSF